MKCLNRYLTLTSSQKKKQFNGPGNSKRSHPFAWGTADGRFDDGPRRREPSRAQSRRAQPRRARPMRPEHSQGPRRADPSLAQSGKGGARGCTPCWPGKKSQIDFQGCGRCHTNLFFVWNIR